MDFRRRPQNAPIIPVKDLQANALLALAKAKSDNPKLARMLESTGPEPRSTIEHPYKQKCFLDGVQLRNPVRWGGYCGENDWLFAQDGRGEWHTIGRVKRCLGSHSEYGWVHQGKPFSHRMEDFTQGMAPGAKVLLSKGYYNGKLNSELIYEVHPVDEQSAREAMLICRDVLKSYEKME